MARRRASLPVLAFRPPRSPAERAERLRTAIAALRERYGARVIRTGAEVLALPPAPGHAPLTTGSLGLDLLMGGLPRGGNAEYAGRDGTGKEALALAALAACQRAGGVTLLLDADHAAEPDALADAGIDVARLVWACPATAGEAWHILREVARCRGLDLLACCSLSGLLGLPGTGWGTARLARGLRGLTTALRGSPTAVVLTSGTLMLLSSWSRILNLRGAAGGEAGPAPCRGRAEDARTGKGGRCADDPGRDDERCARRRVGAALRGPLAGHGHRRRRDQAGRLRAHRVNRATLRRHRVGHQCPRRRRGLLGTHPGRPPPDEEHAYGHSKAEYFSSAVEATLILVAAAAIALAAWDRLWHPQPLGDVWLGLGVSTVATALNGVVALVLWRAGQRLRSITLRADAQHLRADVWTSAGVLIGVVLVALTGWLRLDPLIALLVAANIVWTGLRLLRETGNGLLDAALPPADRAIVDEVLAAYETQGIISHAVRTRVAGQRRFVSLHVLVPGDWTVARGHAVCEGIAAAIAARLPQTTVFTHLEPREDPRSFTDQGLDHRSVEVEDRVAAHALGRQPVNTRGSDAVDGAD